MGARESTAAVLAEGDVQPLLPRAAAPQGECLEALQAQALADSPHAFTQNRFQPTTTEAKQSVPLPEQQPRTLPLLVLKLVDLVLLLRAAMPAAS